MLTLLGRRNALLPAAKMRKAKVWFLPPKLLLLYANTGDCPYSKLLKILFVKKII